MMLQLQALSIGNIFTGEVEIEWNQLDAVSDASRAEIFKNFCDGLNKAFQGQTLTIDQAYNLWKENYPSSVGTMTLEEFTRKLLRATTLISRKNADSELDLGVGID